MSSKEHVDKDLREYLAKADNLRNEDKMNYLRAIFDKHFTFTQLEHLVIKSDLFLIMSQSKSNFSNQKSKLEISGREVDLSDLPHIAVMEAFVQYLNKNNLLKKLVKFDYTDASTKFETHED